VKKPLSEYPPSQERQKLLPLGRNIYYPGERNAGHLKS